MNAPNMLTTTKPLRTTAIASASILMILLTGCSHWPKPGSGGFAEHNAAPHYPIEVRTHYFVKNKKLNPVKKNTNNKNNYALNNSQGLRIDAQLCRNELDTLILQGAKICFPAAVHNATLRQHRIERELTGGLIHDASLNIQLQRFELNTLRQQVNTINPQGLAHTAKCIKPLLGAEQMAAQAQAEKNQHKHLLALLNSDNQFAIGSSALNPKYAARLAKASHSLKTLPHIQLVITGHTDEQGDEQINQPLALARAKEVAGFLNNLGILPNRISVDAVAATKPFSNAKGAEHRLVNRRVTVKFANTNSPAITLEH